MAGSNKHLLMTKTLTGRGRGGLEFLLDDQFLTDDAAPIATPRTCEPGPGTLTVVQPGNECAITGSELVITTTGANAGVISVDTYDRTGGVGVFARRTPSTSRDYFSMGPNYNTLRPGSQLQTTSIARTYGADGEFVASAHAGGAAESTTWMINDGSGVTYFTYNGDLYWVTGTSSLSADKVSYQQLISGRVQKLNRLSVVDLPSNGYTEWATQYGIATSHTASPSTGVTGTQTPDAIVDFTWTPSAGETLDLMVRRVSDAATWSVVCAESAAANGDTIKLIERNGGDTERSTDAQTFTAATPYRIRVIMDGTAFALWVDQTASGTYTDAGSFNISATGVKASGFTTGANLVAYPRDVSSLLPEL